MLEIEDIEEPTEPQRLSTRRQIPKLGGARAGDRSRDEFGLMPRQRVFCDEYMLCGIITRSAVLAGYSVKNADSIGVDLMKVPAVARYIAMRQQEQRDEYDRRRKAVLEELDIIIASDLTKYRRAGDTVVVKDGTDPRQTRALSKIKMKSRTYTREDGTDVTEHEFDLATHSKTAAGDMMLKHLGLYPSAGKSITIEDTDGNTLVIEEVIE